MPETGKIVEAECDEEKIQNCKMFIDNFEKGMHYLKLETCIHISILNFNISNGDGFYSEIGLSAFLPTQIPKCRIRLSRECDKKFLETKDYILVRTHRQ